MEGNGRLFLFQAMRQPLGPPADTWCAARQRPASAVRVAQRELGVARAARPRVVCSCGGPGSVPGRRMLGNAAKSSAPASTAAGTRGREPGAILAARGALCCQHDAFLTSFLVGFLDFFFFFCLFTDEHSICKRLLPDMKNLLFNGPNCCSL